jgi:hypothetical protein
LTTHARLDVEKPRSSWIAGSATFTTVTSRMIINIPTHSTYSANQRERSVVACVAVCRSCVAVMPVPLRYVVEISSLETNTS